MMPSYDIMNDHLFNDNHTNPSLVGITKSEATNVLRRSSSSFFVRWDWASKVDMNKNTMELNMLFNRRD